MANETKLIDNWIFEYFTHRCFKKYIANEYSFQEEDENLIHDIEVLTRYLDGHDMLTKDSKTFIYYSFYQLMCMECSLNQDGDEISCAFITDEDDFSDKISHCIAFAASDTEDAETRALARTVLIHNHVVNYKSCLKRKKSGHQNEALKRFQDFVKMMPIPECQEMYDECVQMKHISPKEDFISDFVQNLKQLVVALFSELDEPTLIKFARQKGLNSKSETSDSKRKRKRSSSVGENKTSGEEVEEESVEQVSMSKLDILLLDKRPCKKTDFTEILGEEVGISQFRKKFENFNPAEHLQTVQRLQKRIHGRPPSHQTFRVGAWMPEEEKAFVRKTLEIGAGYWKEIKTSLNSFRSTQQLKDKWRQLSSTRTFQELKRDSQPMRHNTSDLIPLGRTCKAKRK